MSRPRLTRGQLRLLRHLNYLESRGHCLRYEPSAPLNKLVTVGYVERDGISVKLTRAARYRIYKHVRTYTSFRIGPYPGPSLRTQ